MAAESEWLSAVQARQPILDALANELESWRADDMLALMKAKAATSKANFEKKKGKVPSDRERILMNLDAVCSNSIVSSAKVPTSLQMCAVHVCNHTMPHMQLRDKPALFGNLWHFVTSCLARFCAIALSILIQVIQVSDGLCKLLCSVVRSELFGMILNAQLHQDFGIINVASTACNPSSLAGPDDPKAPSKCDWHTISFPVWVVLRCTLSRDFARFLHLDCIGLPRAASFDPPHVFAFSQDCLIILDSIQL